MNNINTQSNTLPALKILKPLPDTLRKNGFTYTQVLREGRSCIYEQMVSEKLKFYEVFVVQVKPERYFYGKYYPSMEIFPNNESFGQTAWTFRTLNEAMKRFNELKQYHRKGEG